MERAPTREQFKSFDLTAPIDLMRFDIQTTGSVRPETRQRNYDESLTYIAEGVNRPLHTEFNLKELNGNLVYFDRGQWRPYMGMLTTGLETAQREATEDPRKLFQANRAADDWLLGSKFNLLKPGQRLSWISVYPKAEELLYGAEFIQSLGYQPKREMGFLYQAVKHHDGSVTLSSHSVDNSDDKAFINALNLAAQDESADIHDMRARYDATLTQKYGGAFYAGRRAGDTIPEENAWETIKQHTDLTSYYFEKMEELAYNTSLSRDELERSVRRITYGVWAALKQRLDKHSLHIEPSVSEHPLAVRLRLQLEISRSYKELSGRGEALLGCGGVLRGEDSLLEASPEDVFDSIFGKDDEDCDFISKECPKCGEKDVKTKVTKTHISGSCGCRVSK